MKKTLIVGTLLAAMVSMVGCQKVPAGNVGIKVHLLGSEKGVDAEELGPGRYYIGVNEELFLFPTWTQNYVWTKDLTESSPNDESITFQTVEGLGVNADVGISYHLDPKKIPIIFQKYRRSIDEITHVFIRNLVRDAFVSAASTKPVESIYGEGKAALMVEVNKHVKEQVENLGIIIDGIYLVGELRLPPTVNDSINNKIKAIQQAQLRQNEVAGTEAEARKAVVEAKGKADALMLTAKAQAEANRILAESLTPELIKYEAIKMWDGKMPVVMSGEGSSMLINPDTVLPKP